MLRDHVLAGNLLAGCGPKRDSATERDLNFPVVPEGFDENPVAKLKCVLDNSKLRLATKRECFTINYRIGAFKIRTVGGEVWPQRAKTLLFRENGKVGYRFEGTAPSLNQDEPRIVEEKKGK